MSQSLFEVVNENSRRMSLGHAMRNAARERSMLLLAMTRTEDVFERDDLYMELRNQGGVFLEARESILRTNLTPQESAVLQKQRELSRVAGPLQNDVVELLNDDRDEKAYDLLLNHAIPEQHKVIAALDEFILIQEARNFETLQNTSLEFVDSADNMFLFTLAGVSTSIIVSIIVITTVRRTLRAQLIAESELKASNEALEQRVEERTRDLQEANTKLSYMAQYDPVTGLSNRIQFNDVSERMLSKAFRTNGNLTVYYMDLDGFKAINDDYGHEAGDTVLMEISQRMISVIRQEDLLARIGGDEFILVQTDISDREDMAHVAMKIIEAVGEELTLLDTDHTLGMSIGISCFPEDADNIGELVRRADEAMYEVKREGKNNYGFYSQPINEQVMP